VECQAQHVTGPEDHKIGRLHLGADRPRAELDKDLEAVAEQGWALSDGELTPGLRSVAVPVPDGSGKASVAMNAFTRTSVC
jgi:DNA-binding IclR family transcriptional regulator